MILMILMIYPRRDDARHPRAGAAHGAAARGPKRRPELYERMRTRTKLREGPA